MTKTVRARYTLEFKKEAVRLVEVTERLGHGRQDSGPRFGTQAGGNASQIVKVPQCSRCDQTHGNSSSLTGGTQLIV